MTTSDQTNAKQPQPGPMPDLPDTTVSVREIFGFETDLEVPAFAERNEYVPDYDADYLFDKNTTLALLAGFAHNRRVMVQGYHGTGKSTHIEQVASRLNWPCVRVNLEIFAKCVRDRGCGVTYSVSPHPYPVSRNYPYLYLR